MLKNIYVEGFRSLNKFSIDLKPGLNVLVGPNGGGKTNILALFSFISTLGADDIGNAINASGGAAKVFRKIGKTSFVDEVNIGVSGEFPHRRDIYISPAHERRLMDAGYIGLRYEWDFTLNSSLGYDEVFYSRQCLKLKLITKTLFSGVSDGDAEWDIEIKSRSGGPQDSDVIETIYNLEAVMLMRQRERPIQEHDYALVDDDDDSASSVPLFINLSSFIVRAIYKDLQGGTTFNFDPAVCKQPNDSAQSPVLGRNGSGLAATIYAMQKARSGVSASRFSPPVRRRFRPEAAKTLQTYFKLLSRSVGTVNAVNNPFDNKVVVQFSVGPEGRRVDFPLESASDGTVKWLAFVVALLTQSAGFSIEEPENFLHPDVQRNAIELIRTETEGAENLYVLMTTHSETLLNAARPEELIIVSMEDGVTAAKRVDDPSAIDDEIRNTGFGLGYYYISGALDD